MINVNIQKISVRAEDSYLILLKNVSFTLVPANVYTILGKNGCGKTTLLKSLTSLPDKRFFDIRGKVFFKGTDLLNLEEEVLLDLRSKYVKYVFQDPVSSFDPLKKLEFYFDLLHLDNNQLKKWLDFFLLPSVEELGKMHSYELSGGMAQRLVISFALAARPLLLCLDEPNSGIDHAISYLISEALKNFVKESDSIVLLITQDLAFAENTSNYTGMITENTFSGFRKTKDFFAEISDPSTVFSRGTE